jgi:hypothetical protein
VTRPGQATAYKIGQLKITELRTKAKTILGAKFNIKDFHTVRFVFPLLKLSCDLCLNLNFKNSAIEIQFI